MRATVRPERSLHRHGWWADIRCFACDREVMTTDETQRLCPDCWDELERSKVAELLHRIGAWD